MSCPRFESLVRLRGDESSDRKIIQSIKAKVRKKKFLQDLEWSSQSPDLRMIQNMRFKLRQNMLGAPVISSKFDSFPKKNGQKLMLNTTRN